MCDVFDVFDVEWSGVVWYVWYVWCVCNVSKLLPSNEVRNEWASVFQTLTWPSTDAVAYEHNSYTCTTVGQLTLTSSGFIGWAQSEVMSFLWGYSACTLESPYRGIPVAAAHGVERMLPQCEWKSVTPMWEKECYPTMRVKRMFQWCVRKKKE